MWVPGFRSLSPTPSSEPAPPPWSPSTVPEGVKTTLTTAPGQEVTGAPGGGGGEAAQASSATRCAAPTPDVLHLRPTRRVSSSPASPVPGWAVDGGHPETAGSAPDKGGVFSGDSGEGTVQASKLNPFPNPGGR